MRKAIKLMERSALFFWASFMWVIIVLLTKQSTIAFPWNLMYHKYEKLWGITL